MCLWGDQMAMRENSTTHWSDGRKAFQPGVNPGEDLLPISWARGQCLGGAE